MAAYVAWFAFQDATLQDPPLIAGEGAEAEAAFEVFVAQSRRFGFDEVEGRLVEAVELFLGAGWRQVGDTELTDLTVERVELAPQEGRPFAVLRACFVRAGVGVVGRDGAPAPEWADADVSDSVLEARVELVQGGDFDGWYVRSLADVEGESC